ncbi:hypothetical protein OF001_U20290 [Pseudomonas sp. OF001]|uniref:phage tail tape measure protein n=1 Tax=Pseudomonas sp. OF001 TaxID=2772300 RepID=UPI0019185FBF|nr:phage tail tape measure protein [Pseudomonas sp. OF001]CAD5377363.1 hypothetical protein OF001_U20290 [Pseudomonas sp. OF001]
MAKFEVDFSEAFRQLAAFQSRLETMGNALDKLQKDANKPNLAAKKLIKDVTSNMVALEGSLKGYASDMKATLDALDRSSNTAISQLGKIAAANLRLTASADAYLGKNKELERLLADTSAKSAFVRWTEKTRNLTNELAGENKYLSAQIKALSTEEGRTSLIRRATLASQSKQLTAAHQMALANKELKQQEELLGAMYGKSNAVLRARIAETVKAFQEETKLAGKLAETQRATDSLTSGIRRQIIQQEELNKGISQSITFQQRERNAVDELIRRQASLNGGLAEQAVTLKAVNQVREKEITEEIRQQAQLAQLERQLRSLNGGMAENIARTQQAIRERTKQIQADGKERDTLKELTSAEAMSQASNERATSALKAKNAVALELARSIHRMTEAEARNMAQAEALIAATKRHNNALLEEARAAHGMSKAQKELNSERDKAANTLARLKAQKALASSEDGRAISVLRQQIKEQERYNLVLAKSTLELLGFSSAQRKATMSLHAGSQSAAALRAGLAGLQTSIGMYTSSTILLASATYAMAATLRSAVVTGAEFTATMARANAVMNATSEAWQPDGMAAMEAQVRALGATTSYTASEVAAGLVELGQAGLSTTQALLALKPALNLALIGNITMAESSDIATNVMMMFHKEAKDLTNIVDIMAVAASRSNTNITQLANALTYAGPAAQSANVSLEQTTAAIATLSNNGIKASRAGTALRRLFVSIVNPTKKGAAVLDQYGVSVKDAEGKTKSLSNIIRQLNENIPEVDRLAAIQDLVGVYATSPIVALVAKPEEMEKQLRYIETVGNAAEEMRRKIEDNLKFDWKQVTSSFEELKLTVFDNFEWLLRETSKSMTLWMNELKMPAMAFDASGATIKLPNLDPSRITGSMDSTSGQWKADVESLKAFREAMAHTFAIAEDGTNTVYTKLDILTQQAKTFGTVLALSAAGFLAFKVAAGVGGVFSSLSHDAGLMATHMAILRDRTLAAAAANSPLRLSIAAAGTQLSVFRMQAGLAVGGMVSMVRSQGVGTLAMRTYTGAVAMATAAMNAFTLQNAKAALLAAFTGGVSLLTGAMKGLALALQGVAIAGRVAMAALGWAGLILGLYSAWQVYKEADPVKQLGAEDEKAKALENSYRSLTEAVNEYGYARESAALRGQIRSDQEQIDAIGKRRAVLGEKEAEAKARGLDVDFTLEYSLLKEEEARYRQSIENSHAALKDRLMTLGEAGELSDQQVRKAEEIKAAEEARKKITWELYHDADKYNEALKASDDHLAELNRQLDQLRGKSQAAAVSLLTAASRLSKYREEGQKALNANWFDKNATASEQYAEYGRQLVEVRQKIAEAPGKNMDARELVKQETDLLKKQQDLIPELTSQWQSLLDTKEEASLIGKDDAAKLPLIAERLKAAQASRDSYMVNGQAPAFGTKGFSAYQAAEVRVTELLKEQDSIKKSLQKTGEKIGKQADRELEQAKQAFEQLQKKFDPVGAANTALEKARTELSLLRKSGEITPQQEERALVYLKAEHKRAVDEQISSYISLREQQDKNYRSLRELQDAYSGGDSALVKHADEMAKLNQLYADGAVGMLEYLRIKQRIGESSLKTAADGLPTATLPSDNTLATPFSDALNVHLERAQGIQTFEDRADQLEIDRHNGYAAINEEYLSQKDAVDALFEKEKNEADHQARMLKIQADAQRKRDSLNAEYTRASNLQADKRADYEQQMGMLIMSSALGTAQDLLSAYASVAEDATAGQKAAFAAMKALAIAQIIVNTEVAASQVAADMTIPFFGMKVGAAAAIRAMGYASAGMVAATAIGQLAGGGGKSSGGSSYSGAYDDGGFIPYNSYGIVGEYGPEIVHGPANVTSRKESAKQMGGGGEYNITLAPQIVINSDSGQSAAPADAEKQARQMAETVRSAVISTMKDQMRPNGVLDAWLRAKR